MTERVPDSRRNVKAVGFPTGASSIRPIMLGRCTVLLLLVVLMSLVISVLAPAAMATDTGDMVTTMETTEAPEATDAPEDSPGIDLPADTGVTDRLDVVIEHLASINTCLTYIFMFGVVWLLIIIGKLLYSLFNMFF